MGWEETLEMTPALAASTLDWWREAGVDTLVGEEPRDWRKPAPAIVPKAATIGASEPVAEAMPAELEAFLIWLASAPLPYAAPGAPRLAPAGGAQSGLMVMIDMPAVGGMAFAPDTETLFANMLKAMDGLTRESIYLAPLSPIRPPSARLDGPAERALAEIARHHIGLAKPKALLLFGDACARALLGGAVMAVRGRWHDVATPAGPVRATATIRPENMLNRPAFKKTAWEDLQIVMEELKG